jgi:hypothetical protein
MKFYVSGIEGDIMLLKKNNCSEQTDVGCSSHESKIGQILSFFFNTFFTQKIRNPCTMYRYL